MPHASVAAATDRSAGVDGMQTADTEAARKPVADRAADFDTRAVPAGAAVYIGVEAEVAPESVSGAAEVVAAVSAPVRVAEVPVS